MTTKVPEPQELWDSAEILFDEADGRNGLYDRMDALYDQEEPEKVSDTVKLVRMPYFSNTVDLVVDLAAQQELIIEVPVRSETEAAEREADEQEKYLQAWLELNSEAGKANITADLAYLAAQRAVCVARVLYRENSLKNNGDDGFEVGSLPVIMQVRDPRYCVWHDGPDGIDLVAERFERRVSEIRALYPDVLTDKEEHPDDEYVEWTEIWTPQHVAYYAAEQPIPIAGKLVRSHGYGCIPYAIGVARTTPRKSNRYRPLLSSVETLCRNLDTWFSILQTSGWATVTTAWNIFSDSYPIDGSKELDITPNATNFFARGDTVQPLQRAPLPADFFKLGELMMQALQQGTFPFAMYGQVDGSMAGYAINMLTQSGRRALAPIWHAIENCYQGVFRIMAIIMRNKVQPLVGDVVPLMLVQSGMASSTDRKRASKRKIEFRLTHVGDDWACKVTLSDPMPSDEAANLRMAIESTQAGLLSKRTARTKYQLTEDDAAEQELIDVEKIVDQLAPLEAVRLAQRRGYVPRKIKLPEGFIMGPDGQIVPDLGQQTGQTAQEQPAPQGEMPPGGMPGGMPMQPGEMPGMPMQEGAPPGLPPELANLPPELLMQLMAQMQGQGGGMPGGGPPPPLPGMPPEGINPADMQALSGQPQYIPEIDELAGEGGPMMPGMV